jgi:sugar transferase (PEP-CTERM/EpsH1 system associated)
MRALSRRHRLTLVSLHEGPVGPEALAPVAALCEAVHLVPLPRPRAAVNVAGGLFTPRPLQVEYHRSRRFARVLAQVLARAPFDAIHATLIRMAPYVWELQAGPRVVVDLIDALSLNLLSRRAKVSPALWPVYGLEYRRVRAYEQAVARRFRRLVISSAVDREALGAAHAVVIPNGVDLETFEFRGPEGRDPQTLIFTGNMAYPPNEEAVRWFARRVWPALRRKRPGLRWEIIGAAPSVRVRALAGDGISVLGRVPRMADRLARATVSLCPLQSGSGIQNKVLEAMAVGTPVVTTSIGNQGVQAVSGRDLLVADGPDAFTAGVERLLDDAALRARLATHGRTLVQERFQWNVHAERLETLYGGEPAAGELVAL